MQSLKKGQTNIRHNTQKAGFTLVELIVSMGLFTVVIFMSVSLLLALSKVNKEAMGIRNAMTQINILLEDMSREIRSGADLYTCFNTSAVNPCPSFPVTPTDIDNYLQAYGSSRYRLYGNTIMFIGGSGDVIVYRRNSIYDVEKSTDGGATFFKFPEDSYDIDSFYIRQKGTKYDGTAFQPSVEIMLSAWYFGADPYVPMVNLQTRVTQRKPK